MRSFWLAVPLVGIAAACGTDPQAMPTPTQTPTPALEAPAEGEGIQLRGEPFLLQPGEEAGWCTYVNGALGSVIAMHASQAHLGEGGQYVAVYQTAERYEDGGGPCDSRDAGLASWSFITGSFDGAGRTSYPEGTAMAVHPDKTLVVSSRFVNAGSDPLTAEVAVNLYTLPIDEVQHWLGSWQLVNLDVQVPPGGTYESQASCTVPFAMNVVLQMAHTLAAGEQVRVVLTPEGGPDQVLYDGAPMVDDPGGDGTVRYGDAPLALAEGDHITWTCAWTNPTAETLRWPDEMCNVLLTYHPDVGEPLQCPRNVWALEGAEVPVAP